MSKHIRITDIEHDRRIYLQGLDDIIQLLRRYERELDRIAYRHWGIRLEQNQEDIDDENWYSD